MIRPVDFLCNPETAVVQRIAAITAAQRVEMQKNLVDASERVLWTGSRVADSLLSQLELQKAYEQPRVHS